MSGRQRLGGASQLPSAARGIYAPRGSILVPADPPLERSGFLQALFDIFAMIFIALLVCSVALSLPLALFLLLFVRL